MNQPTKGSKTIGAVKTNLQIVDALRELNGATISEITELVDVSKSSVHHHLNTLHECGYVVKDDSTYYFGLSYFSIGCQAMLRQPVLTTGLAEIDSLAAETGYCAHLAVEEHGQIVFIFDALPPGGSVSELKQGTCVEPTTSSVGRAILSQMSEVEVKRVLEKDDYEGDVSEFIASLADVRENKIAFDTDNESDELTIAAPVFGSETVPLGAVCLTINNHGDTQPEVSDELTKAVRTAAGVIGVDTAYSTWIDV